MDSSAEVISLIICTPDPGDITIPHENELFDMCNSDDVDRDEQSFVKYVTNRTMKNSLI